MRDGSKAAYKRYATLRRGAFLFGRKEGRKDGKVLATNNFQNVLSLLQKVIEKKGIEETANRLEAIAEEE